MINLVRDLYDNYLLFFFILFCLLATDLGIRDVLPDQSTILITHLYAGGLRVMAHKISS